MDYEERLFFTVRNLLEYGTYGGDPASALRTLRSHLPPADRVRCGKDFSAYRKAYQDAALFVEARREHYWSEYRNRTDRPGRVVSDAEREFIDAHQGVPEYVQLWMIDFLFDWRFVR